MNTICYRCEEKLTIDEILPSSRTGTYKIKAHCGKCSNTIECNHHECSPEDIEFLRSMQTAKAVEEREAQIVNDATFNPNKTVVSRREFWRRSYSRRD
jgi:hypothetical protein